jgi:DNA polymerase delta subunit 3
VSEDPLEFYPKYGTILNPLVKRRPNRRPIPPSSAPTKAAGSVIKSKPAESLKEASKSSVKPEPKQQSTAAKDFFGKGKEKAKPAGNSEPSSKESTPMPNPPTLKKDTSSIFMAFAKGKPKLKTEGTDLSAGAEDEVMKDSVNFDDDEEETYVPPTPKEESAGDRKSRKEREAQLKAMMDVDDDDVVPTPEPEPEPEEQTIVQAETVKEEPEPITTVSGGRRRGKRRVMRKKTVKDGKGYLGKLFLSHPSMPQGRNRTRAFSVRLLKIYSHDRRASLGIIFGRGTNGASSKIENSSQFYGPEG